MFFCSWPVLKWCTHLSSPWARWPPQPCGAWPPGRSLSGSLLSTWWFTHLWVCRLSHQGACNSVAPAAAWPMAMWTPLTASKREPEMDSSQEQVKLPGWGLWLLSSCLQILKNCTLKWSRIDKKGKINSWTWTTACWLLGAEVGIRDLNGNERNINK